VDYRRCNLRLPCAHALSVAPPHLDRSLRVIAPRLPSVRCGCCTLCRSPVLYAAVDGGWSAWSTCTPACGQGTSTRTCTEPRPSNGGRDCYGDSTKSCIIQQCGATLIALHHSLHWLCLSTWLVAAGSSSSPSAALIGGVVLMMAGGLAGVFWYGVHTYALLIQRALSVIVQMLIAANSTIKVQSRESLKA
jgi:hypothetical protein